MTFIAFLLSGLAAFAWYSLTGSSVIIPNTLTIYTAWFALVFLTCGVYVFIRSDLQTKLLYMVLAVFWIVGQIIWANHWGYFAHGELHAITALCFYSLGNRPSHFAIGYLFMSMVGIDLLAYHGSITPGELRGRVFVSGSYPDLLGLASHVAAVTLGAPWDGLCRWISRAARIIGGLAFGHHPAGAVRGGGVQTMARRDESQKRY